MSYLVLARKYRPQTFADVIGQEHITSLLGKSIESGRLAHAFLFCGPRGVGKTSCARILAKCLNCEKGPTLTPCGTCFPCQEIASSNSFDVIEIDGASNRGIDEIRTLRENVKFAPSYGRFKIYIVDEVHMLTTEAFNALLKTLEEPPPHVKFIFATTEANKVPATILSRCQRFDFKRVSVEMISGNLRDICKKENVAIDDGAIFAVAKAAQGSMRDALSVLDQLSALGDEGVKAQDVFSMLGMVETELLFSLTDALIDKQCSQSLTVFNDIIDRGKDIKQLSKDLAEHFRHLMIAKIGGPSLSSLIDYPAAIKQRIGEQAGRTSIPVVLKSIDLLIEAQETSRIMENQRMPLEMAFAKICFGTAITAAPTTAASSAPQTAPVTAQRPIAASVSTPRPSVAKPVAAPEAAAPVAKAGVHTWSLEQIQQQWNTLTHEVSKKKMSLATYLQDGTPTGFKGGQLTISFNREHEFAKESLESKENMTLVEKAISERLGAAVTMRYWLTDDQAPAKEDEPVVKNALDTFGGQVVKEWHNES